MKSIDQRFATFFFAMALTAILGCASNATQEGSEEYVDDAVIASKVKAAILRERALKSAEIKVETYKGVVHLSGIVSSAADEQKATELARSIKGVKFVTDDLRVK